MHQRWLLVQDLEFNAVTEDTNIKAMPVSNDGEIKTRTKAIKAAHYAMNQKIREAWNTKSAEEVVKALTSQPSMAKREDKIPYTPITQNRAQTSCKHKSV